MTDSKYHLAQLNVAYGRAPLDDPIMADFVNNLTHINGLGAQSPGFVWQLTDDSGNSTTFRINDEDNLLINMTVWESVEALYDFTYKSQHVDFFRRRREWFEKMDGPSTVLWWIPAGHVPTLEEAAQRLAHLQEHGPTPIAFTFRQRYSIEETLAAANPQAGD